MSGHWDMRGNTMAKVPGGTWASESRTVQQESNEVRLPRPPPIGGSPGSTQTYLLYKAAEPLALLPVHEAPRGGSGARPTLRGTLQ